MALERIQFPDFREENADSRYPFSDTSTLLATSGQQLDRDTLLDASLYPIGGSARLHLARIDIAAREVTLRMGDDTNQIRCSGSFDPLDPPYEIELLDDFDRPAGVLVSDPLRLSLFAAWPTGEHVLPIGTAEFVASCVIPTPEIGVRGILTDRDELLTGDVWIVGDHGVVVRAVDAQTIRIDVVGDPLFRRRLCLPESLFNPPRFVETINGCPPDEFGNFNLIVGDHIADDTVLRIYPVNGGLQIEAVGKLARG